MLVLNVVIAQQKIKFKIPNEKNNGPEVDYEGAVENGRANGYGKGKLSNGNTYEGNWKDNTMDGKGKIAFKNGDVYEGDFKKNSYNGKGKLVYKNGDINEGEFANGSLNGKGKQIWNNGKNIYEGNYLDGKRHGKGQQIYESGDTYEGSWENGKEMGFGTYTFADGRKYVGQNKDLQWEGKGTFYYTNGDTYEGDWKNSDPNGNGTYTTDNGYKYVGEWVNGKKHGLFKLIKSDGMYAEGIIDSTKSYIVKGFIYQSDGKISHGFADKNSGNYDGYCKVIYNDGSVSEGKWVKGKLEKEMNMVEYEKENNVKLELPVKLPEWIAKTNLIDTSKKLSKDYLIPKTNTYFDFNNAQKEFFFTLRGEQSKAKMARIYTFTNTQKQILFDVSEPVKYQVTFKNDGAYVNYYTIDKKDIYDAFYIFKIPAKGKSEEWSVTFEKTDYHFKAINATVKIGTASLPAIVVTQTKKADAGYKRVFYYVKGKGLYKVEENAKLFALLK